MVTARGEEKEVRRVRVLGAGKREDLVRKGIGQCRGKRREGMYTDSRIKERRAPVCVYKVWVCECVCV